MTQKDLADAINESIQLINDYESGKAIPGAQILSKLELALGIKLPRNKTKQNKTKNKIIIIINLRL